MGPRFRAERIATFDNFREVIRIFRGFPTVGLQQDFMIPAVGYISYFESTPQPTATTWIPAVVNVVDFVNL